jgi:hypothetical protein
LFNVVRRVIVLSCGGRGLPDHVSGDNWMTSLQKTMIFLYAQLLGFCTNILVKNKDKLVRSLGMLSFIAIEKAATRGF